MIAWKTQAQLLHHHLRHCLTLLSDIDVIACEWHTHVNHVAALLRAYARPSQITQFCDHITSYSFSLQALVRDPFDKSLLKSAAANRNRLIKIWNKILLLHNHPQSKILWHELHSVIVDYSQHRYCKRLLQQQRCEQQIDMLADLLAASAAHSVVNSRIDHLCSFN